MRSSCDEVPRGGRLERHGSCTLVHDKLSDCYCRFAARSSWLAHAPAPASASSTRNRPARSVDAVAGARAGGQPELRRRRCTDYACFTAGDYRKPRGFCYHTYPSLKYPQDQPRALGRPRARRGISAAATDEFRRRSTMKLTRPDDRDEDVTGGNLGAEARMGIVCSEGVVKRGDAAFERFVGRHRPPTPRGSSASTPRRASIARPAATPNIALIDPAIAAARWRRDDFRRQRLQPVGGWAIAGWPVTTILLRTGGGGESAHGLRQSRRQAGGAQDLARVLPPGLLARGRLAL